MWTILLSFESELNGSWLTKKNVHSRVSSWLFFPIILHNLMTICVAKHNGSGVAYCGRRSEQPKLKSPKPKASSQQVHFRAMSSTPYHKLLQVSTKIIAVGRNYAAHAKELGNAVPKVTYLFHLQCCWFHFVFILGLWFFDVGWIGWGYFGQSLSLFVFL